MLMRTREHKCLRRATQLRRATSHISATAWQGRGACGMAGKGGLREVPSHDGAWGRMGGWQREHKWWWDGSVVTVAVTPMQQIGVVAKAQHALISVLQQLPALPMGRVVYNGNGVKNKLASSGSSVLISEAIQPASHSPHWVQFEDSEVVARR
jgi:hypothetical protein